MTAVADSGAQRGGAADRAGQRAAAEPGVQAQADRQRCELDGPDTDVKAEQAEQAGREQVMGTANTREQRTDSEGDRRN
jgi:hypothetical protein